MLRGAVASAAHDALPRPHDRATRRQRGEVRLELSVTADTLPANGLRGIKEHEHVKVDVRTCGAMRDLNGAQGAHDSSGLLEATPWFAGDKTMP